MTSEGTNPYAAPASEVLDSGNAAYTDVRAFSLKGRLGRVRYMAYLTVLLLVVWVGGGIVAALAVPALANHDRQLLGMTIGLFMLVVYGVMVVALFILAIRRINDFDTSGWFALLFLLPGINVILGVSLWFIPGTRGANRYGDPTPPNGAGTKILAALLPLLVFGYFGIIASSAIPAYQNYVERAAQMPH